MTTEEKDEATTEAPAETSGESPAPSEPTEGESAGIPEGETAPEWKFKTEFGINERMREIVEMTIRVANDEIARNRRKIDKLTYGV